MNFSYDGNVARLYDNIHVNIFQTYNPYNNTAISDKDEAIVWMKQCLLNTYNSMIIFLSVSTDNEDAFKINTSYKFNIKESTGNLTGVYKVKFIGEDNKIEKDVMFTDGEAIIDITFKHSDTYVIDLDNEFYIGSQRYIYVVDESENGVRTTSFNDEILIINVED